MKRVATAVVLLGMLVLAASVSGGSAQPGKAEATKITIWVGWSAGHELKEFKKVVAEYDAKNADVEVNVVGGINDDKILAALRAGNAPDVVSSFSSQNVGIYCPSGGWIDLAPYLQRDKINVNIFPKASRYYTQYKGKRCALPLLADSYGFYYNTALFKQAGLTRPPKTFTELTAYAKKLTVKNADGSFKVLGYNPNPLFYHGGGGITTYGPLIGATYFDKSGKSNLSRDSGWSRLLRWQKSLIDFYGYNNLVKWQTGAGDEFSASHAFERGKLAMMLDGEWRVAFIKNEHPELKYATAPMPVDDQHKSSYGSGYINGTIIGIPKSGKHRDEAWDLVKYLTTNDHALAKFSNGIRNVPSTVSSSKSKELLPDKNFNTFLQIFTHPKSNTVPITPIGADHLQTFSNFIAKWYSGKVNNLQSGLGDVDKQIDAKIKRTGEGAGGPP
jgi:ABC-type glycerol-3-phosphate transport system substrate-binding protein